MKKLGFGLMRLPTVNGKWEDIDLEKSREMIDKYMAEGFTYFDTAYVYHGGNSERAFGELVASRYPRDSYVVTSKMPVGRMKETDTYESIFNEQLERCKIEYFDYYFLHAIGKSLYERIEKEDGFGFLKRMKQQGKIRHIGFSFHDDADSLDEILTKHPETELVQIQLNYIDWEDQGIQSRRCYEVCLKHGVDIAIMEPLKGGALVSLPEEAQNVLKEENSDMSIASWGIRFAASLENVKIVLSGMSNMEQLCDNMSYMNDFKPLRKSELNAVWKAADIIKKSIAVPCTACKYCIEDCPKNIAIPEYFAVYNNQHKYGLIPGLIFTYKNIAANKGKPSECIACGMCEKNCPQHIDIIENLKKVSEIFEK